MFHEQLFNLKTHRLIFLKQKLIEYVFILKQINIVESLLNQPYLTAHSKLQRMETVVFHFISPVGGVLRPEHVCRRGGGKLPQVS